MNTDRRMVWPVAMFGVVLMASSLAQAQPRYDDPPEYRERNDEREAYRRGYERGFERGYAKGMDEGQRRAPPVAAPVQPRLGNIHILSASYGTSSRSCDAIREIAHRANGKRSFSLEVTNGLCGDPVPGQRKSLDVAYRCGDFSKTASANEHRTLSLDCNTP